MQGYMVVSKKLIWISNKVAMAKKSSSATDYADHSTSDDDKKCEDFSS